jgi:hypothetical protein
MEKSLKMEGNYHGQRWTTSFLWKEGIKQSDIYELSAICAKKALACSTMFGYRASALPRKLHRQLSVSGIKTFLKKMVPLSHPGARKEMAAIYRPKRGIY